MLSYLGVWSLGLFSSTFFSTSSKKKSFYKCNGTTNLCSLLALYHKVGTINTYHLFNTNDMFIYFLIRRRAPGLSNTLLGQMLNKRYIPIDYGYPHATLIHSLFPPKKSTLGACLSKSRLLLDFFCRGPSTTIQGETPIPVFARSTPFALSLCSIAKSRLSLDAGVSPSIDLYHIVTIHMKPTKPYVLQSCKKDMYHTKAL